MSAQRLSERSVRRLARYTALPIVQAWPRDGRTVDFVIADASSPDRHRHGWYDKRSGTWGLVGVPIRHEPTCPQLFPPQGGIMSNDKSAATYHPDTPEEPERNAHGGVIHQVAGTVGVGSDSGMAEPEPEP